MIFFDYKNIGLQNSFLDYYVKFPVYYSGINSQLIVR
jgi:hypothetical protein